MLENPIAWTPPQGLYFLPTSEAERSLITAPSSSHLLTPIKRFEGPGVGTRQAAGCPGAQAVLQQAGVERSWGPAGGRAGGLVALALLQLASHKPLLGTQD